MAIIKAELEDKDGNQITGDVDIDVSCAACGKSLERMTYVRGDCAFEIELCSNCVRDIEDNVESEVREELEKEIEKLETAIQTLQDEKEELKTLIEAGAHVSKDKIQDVLDASKI